MPKKDQTPPHGQSNLSTPVEDMVAFAQERDGETLETGRYIVTFKQSGVDEGRRSLEAQGLRVADARDSEDQAIAIESVGDADAVVLPEIGIAIISGPAVEQRSLTASTGILSSEAVEAIEPEYFVYAQQAVDEYLRGFVTAAEAIARDLRATNGVAEEEDIETQVAGATWGLVACKVPPSVRSGAGIKVAVLDTGMDTGHPDFAGRTFVTQSFVGQPVRDLNGHGTHCIGTACGPKAPAGPTPRYGIAYRAPIFVGKVLTNSGSGTTGTVLAGMNWAIANRCVVISMSLGAQTPVQAAYTAAGQAALRNGCLIVAAAGNYNLPTGAPANSPTIMSVASLDKNLARSSFSNHGKVEISAPGRDVFSSVPRPGRYRTMTGTSMATPHVAGCAALWAETSPTLRGKALWNRLLTSARPLPLPPSRVGKGLVQAP
jgi:hypothetical protein